MQSGVNSSNIIEQILAKRGITDATAVEAFLYPDYGRHSHDPFLLSDMMVAVKRILQAATRRERVVIYGDYDIDGITASAVLIEGLEAWGIEATSYIPDRFEEGYGINQAALEAIQLAGADLVISVDCGITSLGEALWAKQHGLDLIITDHHSVGPTIPEALAVINPKRAGDKYPFKDLAGVGVAFKLIQALQKASLDQSMSGMAIGQEKWLLDLVALGTVCDVVTLVDENRLLVQSGLKVLHKTRRVGLRVLANIGGYDIADTRSYHLGYILGPRLNAAGRLEHAAESLELLLTADPLRADAIASNLDRLNTERRGEQARIVEEATALAEQMPGDGVLVLADADWSHGVVGIAASKLVERFGRPVLVMQILGDMAKGSARSVAGFNMVEALRENQQLLTKFGGHHFAAGYSLPVANIDQLRQGLSKLANNQIDSLSAPLEGNDQLSLDNLGGLDLAVVADLDILEPYGSANHKPLFAVQNLQITQLRAIGADRSHLKLQVADGAGQQLEAIGFGLAKLYPDLAVGDNCGLVFELSENDFNGRKSLQLVVRSVL